MGNHELDRRHFLRATAALSALSLCGVGFGDAPVSALSRRIHTRKRAFIRGAFFYPPEEVVLKGKTEDGWSQHEWFTWPGNQFRPEEHQAKFMREVRRICRDLNLKLEIDEAPLYTSEGLAAFVKDIEDSRPDALLLFNFWNSFSGKIQPILDGYKGPIILYHPVGSNHQLPPKNLATAERTQYIHSIENWPALERGLRAVHAHTNMEQSRLLRVSGKLKAEADDTEKFWGTPIHGIPAAQFNDLFDKIEYSPELKRLAGSVRRHAMRVTDLSSEAFADAVRAHAAVLKLLRDYDADAITIECLFLKHRKPCLSFSLNNDVLVPCGCENDLNATLTLMLGSHLFGRGGFQHNPDFDTEENIYLASHCTCATRLHGPEEERAPYMLRPFFHQMPKSVALDVQWPKGESATLFKYHTDKKSMDAWSGVVVGSPTCPPVGGCATRVLVKMNDVKDIQTVYPGPHPALFCGDFAKNAKVYSQLYGLTLNSNV